MDFTKWVKSIQTAGYNGARTVLENKEMVFKNGAMNIKAACMHMIQLFPKVKRTRIDILAYTWVHFIYTFWSSFSFTSSILE
jgi:hypothetical protein